MSNENRWKRQRKPRLKADGVTYCSRFDQVLGYLELAKNGECSLREAILSAAFVGACAEREHAERVLDRGAYSKVIESSIQDAILYQEDKEPKP